MTFMKVLGFFFNIITQDYIPHYILKYISYDLEAAEQSYSFNMSFSFQLLATTVFNCSLYTVCYCTQQQLSVYTSAFKAAAFKR